MKHVAWALLCTLGAAGQAMAEPVRLEAMALDAVTAGFISLDAESVANGSFLNTGENGNFGIGNQGSNNVGMFNDGDGNKGAFNGLNSPSPTSGNNNRGIFNGNNNTGNNVGNNNTGIGNGNNNTAYRQRILFVTVDNVASGSNNTGAFNGNNNQANNSGNNNTGLNNGNNNVATGSNNALLTTARLTGLMGNNNTGVGSGNDQTTVGAGNFNTDGLGALITLGSLLR